MEIAIGACYFLVLLLVSIISYSIFDYVDRCSQLKELKENGRTDLVNFKDFDHIYKSIKSSFNLDYFKLVYSFYGFNVIKIKKNYFKIDGNSLILIFNEDELLKEKIEEKL
ncbi:MAG: hypothetical protein ACI4TI_00425 [Christensenellales bacterium]